MKIKVFFLFTLLFCWPIHSVDAKKDTLAQIQAAYLVNFIKYTIWQDKKENEPLRVAVLGPDVFCALKDVSLIIHRRKLDIYEVRKENIDFSNADVVFLSKDMAGFVPNSVWNKIPSSTLVVSDSEDILDKGGTIQLKIINDKLRFLINISRLSGVSINANLLQLAVVVVQ